MSNSGKTFTPWVKNKNGNMIFITALVFLKVVIRMNEVFFSFAFLIGSERGFEASVFFFSMVGML